MSAEDAQDIDDRLVSIDAIGQAVEAALGERRGRPEKTGANAPNKGKARDVAGKKAGFDSGDTYARAKKVVASGAPVLVQAMDEGNAGGCLNARRHRSSHDVRIASHDIPRGESI